VSTFKPGAAACLARVSTALVACGLWLTGIAYAHAPFERLVDFPLTGGSLGSVGNGIKVGDLWFFIASSPEFGMELWRSDGTTNGTVAITESISPGPVGLQPTNLTAVGSILYFVVDTTDLWKSDGTSSGTTFVKRVRSSSELFGPMTMLTAVDDMLFFVADDGDGIFGGLWKSDGTSAGTQKVKAAGVPSRLTAAQGTLFLTRQDSNGTELWKSDGTDAGTVMVKDIAPGSTSGLQWLSTPMTAMGNAVYFAANDGTNGLELWRSDGTESGTTMVADIQAGALDSNPSPIESINGTLFFAAFGGSGSELWKSDGTTAGTVFVQTVDAYAASDQTYKRFASVGGTLFFAGTDATNGNELWSSLTSTITGVHPL